MNLVLTPVELGCIPLFIAWGESAVVGENTDVSALLQQIQEDPMAAISQSGMLIVYGVAAWTVLTPGDTELIALGCGDLRVVAVQLRVGVCTAFSGQFAL